ncbi:MAG: choice-of-anchor Q domain-containing protein [Bacteriovoracia bacterium]
MNTKRARTALILISLATSGCLQATLVNPLGPAITYSTPVATYVNGQAIIQNTPTYAGGAISSFTISPTLPNGLSFNTTTGIISGTPAQDTEATEYRVLGLGATATYSGTVSIQVNPAAPTALTLSADDVFFPKDSAITPITPTATGTVTSYSVSPALPTGLSIDPTTGVISGTSTQHQVRWYDYTVTASNVTGSVSAALRLRTAKTYVVDATSDATDASPGDGTCATAGAVCTLRAAVAEIVGAGGGNVVAYIPANKTISLGSTISITAAVDIVGGSQTTSIVDATGVAAFNHNHGDEFNFSNFTIRNATVAGHGGAALYTETFGTNVNLDRMTFKSNSVTGGSGGGAVAPKFSADYVVRKCVFDSNTTSSAHGAGIATNYSVSSTFLITDSYFYNNRSLTGGYLGGAIGAFSNSTLTVERTLFKDNTTSGNGGAISASGTTVIKNSTFSGNTANVHGGAISGGALTLINNTFVNNSAAGGGIGNGGAIYTSAATLKNNILYGNIGSIGADNCEVTTLTSQGGNISGTTLADCNLNSTDDLVSTNPLLGALQDNGGLTHTFAPAGGSPAIGRGVLSGCPSTDQRGEPRPGSNGTCDSGAYQTQN